tara:strand:- start:8290 stop:9219 length:930 start_codon:yes stop_codon:yes gene_type:complete
MKDTAILLLAFGGPDTPEAILPFLKNVMSGRAPSPGMMNSIKKRYCEIGGKSPITEITRKQAQALQKQLEKKSEDTFGVYTGMRHWHPFIKETLSEITDAGCKKIIAICMTPQRSNYSANAYEKDVSNGLDGLKEKPDLRFVSQWHMNRRFHEAVAEKISEAMIPFKENGQKTAVIFSAHSLPLKVMDNDDPYVNQINETIKGVSSVTGELDWKLGYQSKGLAPGEWLEPTVDTIIENLPTEGYKNVLIVPIVFVSDHVETLYDIDIVYRQKTESLGLNFQRTKSLNDSPKFIEALSEIVVETLNHRDR